MSGNQQSIFTQITEQPLTELAIKIVIGLLLLWVGVRIGRWIADLQRRVLLRAHVDEILAQFLRNVTYTAVLALTLISALEFTGFPTTSLLTVLGAAGLAIGLALKDSLAHIAAGVILIALRPFRVGDSVRIAGQEGVVEGVFIFQTRLHTPDNRDIVLMNGAVIAAPIVNYSRHATRRADVVLTLIQGTDLTKAFEAAREAITADARIHKDPAPNISIADITDRGVAMSMMVWSNASDLDSVRSDLLMHLYSALASRDIALAQFPLPMK